jgi:hypothetical protein
MHVFRQVQLWPHKIIIFVAKISQQVNKNFTKAPCADFGLARLLHFALISRDLSGGYPSKTDKKICARTKP